MVSTTTGSLLVEENVDDDTAQESQLPREVPYCRSSKLVELILCFLIVPVGVGLEFGHPYQRAIPYEQSINGDSISFVQIYNHEVGSETVSSSHMFVVGIALPFLLQIGWILWCRGGCAGETIHKTLCLYFAAVGWTQTLTNACKLYCGYFRPNFYDYCSPVLQEDNNYGSYECTSQDSHKGRVSFVSGHASMSFCGMLLFSLFLDQTFGLFPPPSSLTSESTKSQRRTMIKNPSWQRLVSMACYAPMLVAFFIGISRVHDNFHHPADVVGGALLGGSIAKLMFGIWFG